MSLLIRVYAIPIVNSTHLRKMPVSVIGEKQWHVIVLSNALS